MRSSTRRRIIALVALATFTAACGSRNDDGATTTSNDEPASTEAPAPAGPPVKLGLVGTLSGPIGATLTPVRDGVEAWVADVNERGGVDGHPVELIVEDDGGDAAKHRAIVQTLVEERGVIAFVGNPDGFSGAGTVDYLEEVQVPVVGTELGAPWSYDSPMVFPQASAGPALAEAAVRAISVQAKDAGKDDVGFVACAEIQLCRDSAALAEEQTAENGVNLVYTAEVSIAQPDFTAECLAAEGEGAQVIGVVLDGTGVSRLAESCARQGYQPTFAYSSAVILPDHETDPNLQGAFIPVNVAPWFIDLPAWTRTGGPRCGSS